MRRAIKDTVRSGRVTRVEADRVILEQGGLESTPETLHIDCMATAPPVRGLKPGFEDRRACSKHSAVRDWGANPGLDGDTKVVRECGPDDAARTMRRARR
ncbi:MAG: hypothetical protein ACOC20_02630 [Oceanicaulis sp.]